MIAGYDANKKKFPFPPSPLKLNICISNYNHSE